jgi:serine/threonine protein kinase
MATGRAPSARRAEEWGGDGSGDNLAALAPSALLSSLPHGVLINLRRRGFIVLRELGHGSFGVALLVREERTGEEPGPYNSGTSTVSNVPNSNGLKECQHYVVKVIDISGLKEKERRATIGEVEVLRQLKHPNIIGYHGSWISEPHLYIVLEYADGGDLAQAIKRARSKGRQFSEERVMYWACQIGSALRYVHSKRILHRDLKASNVFLHTKDRIVKLGDFGIARVLAAENSLASTVIGTPYNMSPELINSEVYSYKSDIWALGCVLYELCTLRHAFDASNMCALVLRILRGTYPPIDTARYGAELRALVTSMLQLDPDMRPNVTDIIKMPLFQRALRSALEKEDSLGYRHLWAAHELSLMPGEGQVPRPMVQMGAGAMPSLLTMSRETSLYEDSPASAGLRAAASNDVDEAFEGVEPLTHSLVLLGCIYD